MSAARTSVLVPMKDFARAKSRLRSHLDDRARTRLARAMFERVLLAALGCERVEALYVITDGASVAELARAHGARVLHDPVPAPAALGQLIDWGLSQLQASGAARALVLMADLPGLATEDVRSLCALLDDHGAVAAPDRHGCSTNALGVTFPYDIPTAFGLPKSYAEHALRIRARGISLGEHKSPGLLHDVDLASDL